MVNTERLALKTAFVNKKNTRKQKSLNCSKTPGGELSGNKSVPNRVFNLGATRTRQIGQRQQASKIYQTTPAGRNDVGQPGSLESTISERSGVKVRNAGNDRRGQEKIGNIKIRVQRRPISAVERAKSLGAQGGQERWTRKTPQRTANREKRVTWERQVPERDQGHGGPSMGMGKKRRTQATKKTSSKVPKIKNRLQVGNAVEEGKTSVGGGKDFDASQPNKKAKTEGEGQSNQSMVANERGARGVVKSQRGKKSGKECVGNDSGDHTKVFHFGGEAGLNLSGRMAKRG